MTTLTKTKTKGISPKVLLDLLVTIVSFILTYYAIDLDPEVAALISKALGTGAGVLASPGTIEGT